MLFRIYYCYYFLLPLCLLFVHSDCLEQHVRSTLAGFSKHLLRIFEEQSRIDLVEEEIRTNIDGKLATSSISVTDLLQTVHRQFEQFVHSKIAALRNIVENAEHAARSQLYSFEYDPDEASCTETIDRMNEVDLKLYSGQPSTLNRSGIHITVEAYRCENSVRRDFEWTSSPAIEQAFLENIKKDPQIVAQYIGTTSGLTRLFPTRRWVIDPEPITIDLYDPRFRPWFVNAQSAPKDVLFLIDMSGSVKGQTVHLIRMTVLHILATLSPNDYINAIWFNSRQVSVLRGCFDGFIPATTRNKRILRELLNAVEERDQANINHALNYSLSLFLKEEANLTDAWNETWITGSGGHKLIMLFTDGSENRGPSVVESRREALENDTIRIFGFSMGYGIGSVPALNNLACLTNAVNTVIDQIADVKRQSIAYFTKLSEILAYSLDEKAVAERPISWTTPYMDSQGAGPTVSLSMPILNKMENGSGLLGVAAVDILFKQIDKILPETEQVYAFIIDNNGVAIYHPLLKVPKTEVYSVRRTACYDKRSRSRGGAKVQFGEVNERVLKLMGLSDSIPTIDIAELESETVEFRTFRKTMINRACEGFMLSDGDKDYYCKTVEGTPLTIGFVSYRRRNETVLNASVQRPLNPHKDLVGHYVPKRGLCRGDLDHVDMMQRFNAFLESEHCQMDTRLPYALIASMNKWTESWPSLALNATCATNPLPPGFDPLHHITSFVNTFNHITAYYPRCNFEQLLPAMDVLELKRYLRSSDKLQIVTIVDNQTYTTVAYKGISDSQYGIQLAVAGTQWSVSFLEQIFANFTRNVPNWAVCHQLSKVCQVISSDGFIVAGENAQQHLSKADPLFFAYLVRKSIIRKTVRRDNQAQCSSSQFYLFSPSAAPTKLNLFSVIILRLTKLLTTAFWFDIWMLLAKMLRGASSQPVVIGGTCQFSRVKKKELCSLEYSMYDVQMDQKRRFLLNDGICSRDISIMPFPDVTLYLIVADKPCTNSSTRFIHGFAPKRVSECERIKPQYRRRRTDLDYTRQHWKEPKLKCSSVIPSRVSSTMITVVFWLTISHLLLN